MRSTAGSINADAKRAFEAKMSSVLTKFASHQQATRSALYSQMELQARSKIGEMEEQTSRVKEEVYSKYESAGRACKEEMFSAATIRIEEMYESLEAELVRRVLEEGPDVAARQRSSEALLKEIGAAQSALLASHKVSLEKGALLRLNEREGTLAEQRSSISDSMEEETRVTLKELSALLSASAKDSLNGYRVELEDLRCARVKAEETLQASLTETEIQTVKDKLMLQATEEVRLVQVGALHEEEAALNSVKDEVRSEIMATSTTKITKLTTLH